MPLHLHIFGIVQMKKENFELLLNVAKTLAIRQIGSRKNGLKPVAYVL